MFIFVFCSDSLLSSVKYGVPQAGIRVYEVRDSFDLRGMRDSGRLPDSEIQQRGVCVGKGRVYADLNRVVE